MSAPRDERPGEAELREAFAELRDAEEARVPPLASLLARPPRRRRPAAGGRWLHLRPAVAGLAAAATVALAAGLGLWLGDAGGRRRGDELAREAAVLTGWTAPTDFLLDTPGSELWSGTPQIPGPLPMSLPLSTSDTDPPTGEIR